MAKAKTRRKAVAHTDIVVKGFGFNVSVHRLPSGKWRVKLMPDVPGPEAEKAAAEFWSAMGNAEDWPTEGEAKIAVEAAVDGTGAEWNRWHREKY